MTDDAAVLGLPAGKELAITADTLVCDVHFRRNDPARTVAHKLLAVNLSDLAAMGATPYAYTLAVAWPGDLDLEWIKDFAAGLGAAQEHWRIDVRKLRISSRGKSNRLIGCFTVDNPPNEICRQRPGTSNLSHHLTAN